MKKFTARYKKDFTTYSLCVTALTLSMIALGAHASVTCPQTCLGGGHCLNKNQTAADCCSGLTTPQDLCNGGFECAPGCPEE